MNVPGEHLQLTNAAQAFIGSGLLWRPSEDAAAWKGDLLSTTSREHPMPFKLVLPTPTTSARRMNLDAEPRLMRVDRGGPEIMSEPIATHVKDPAEVLDYPVEWASMLDGDTINSSTFAVDQGISKDMDGVSGSLATVWLSGGQPFGTYRVTNTLITAGGRTLKRSFLVRVEPR